MRPPQDAAAVVPPPAATTPPPAPTPPPAAPAPPPVAAALVAPALTASPPLPFYSVGPPPFETPGAPVQFPLLLTAISAPFAGDPVTTEQGGTIDLASDRTLRLTLNNTALGVSGVPLANDGRNAFPDRFFLSLLDPLAAQRRHLRNGVYLITTSAGFSGGAWATGFVPRFGDPVPFAGVRTYTGAIRGLISEYHIPGGGGVGLLGGNVQLGSDFGARTVSGRITGLRVGSDGTYVTGPVNELTFTATFNPASNSYSGEVVAGASPGGPNAFQAGARGTISGKFFGPHLSESGAVLTLSDGTSRLILSFSVEDVDPADD